MDKGIIRSLKAKYQTKIIQKTIDAIDNDIPLPITSIIEGMRMLIIAWDDVSNTTVQRCFKKAGFPDEEKDGDSDDPFSTLKHSTEQFPSRDET